MIAPPVSSWLRFPWLPGEPVLLHHRPVRVLPVFRLIALAVIAVLGSLREVTLFGLLLPRWALPVTALVLAALSVPSRRNGRVPEGVTWAVNDGSRVGLLATGYPVPGDERIGSLTWFGPEMTAVLSDESAEPVSQSAIRLLRSTGRDIDEDEFLALAQAHPAELILADHAGAAQVLAPRVGVTGSPARFGGARRQVLGWFSESAPLPRPGRITLEDVRTIATTGIAPGHRLETMLGEFAVPTEADERLGLGYPRCWPSRVDGHEELAEADRINALRADLAAQVARDEKSATGDSAEQVLISRWSRRWQDRLDAIAYSGGLSSAPPPEISPARPPLSTAATLVVRLVAAETDVSSNPLRSKLTALGVPAEPSTVAIVRGARAGLWRTADTTLIVLTGAALVLSVYAMLR